MQGDHGAFIRDGCQFIAF
uniref:Uncharacterized protein n=1 Tax=Lepeophtheirus salmonis TaxID=72036 RepID=A0A0K2UEV5_LEPSM